MTRALLFDAPGPPGPAGPRGVQGPKGDPGPNGAAGIDVRNFGAHCNGSNDDTVAIQAAIDSMVSTGVGPVVIPGNSIISATLKMTNGRGLAIKGLPGARLIWAGPSNPASPVPAVWLESCYECDLSDLDITTNGSVLDEGVRLSTKALPRSYVSTRNMVSRVHVYGITDEVTVGFQLGGQGIDANNDFHVFSHCGVQNYRRSAWKSDDTQVYSIVLENCVSQGLWKTQVSSMASGTTTLPVSALSFSSRDIGGYIEVSGVGPAGATLRTTIAAIIDSTHITLSSTASTTSSTATVTYGSSFGFENNAGNFALLGGGFNNCLGSAVYTTGLNNGGIILDGAIHEGNRCELATSGPSSSGHKRVSFRNCRLSGDSAVSYADYLEFGLAGELVIEDTDVGDFGVTSNPVNINFLHGGGSPQYGMFTFRDSCISSSLPFGNNVGNCFSGYAPTEVVGTCLYSGTGGVQKFNRVPMSFGVGASLNIDWGYSLTWDVSTNSATFTMAFLNGRIGLGATHVVRILNNTAGAITLVWPGSVNWGAAGAPTAPASGKYLIASFYFDGTTYFGTLVGTSY